MRKLASAGIRVASAAALLLLFGCGANYYSVKDPVGGKTYYTTEVQDVSGGAVKFKDAKSGAAVTIQNSAVKEISEQEFNVGIYTPEPAKPAPAPPPPPVQVQVVPAAPAAAPVQIQVVPAAPAPSSPPAPPPAPLEAPAPAK